jgi:Concanavalin A-like lectin/glucanases superfamily
MKTYYNSLTLFLFIFLFISCEKKDSESKPSSYSYLNEPDFIKNGLIGYYPFNGDLKDYSGHANHATGTSTTFNVDRFNNSAGAIHFNGINDFVIIPNFSKSLVNNEGTIVIWSKVDTPYLTNNQLKSVVLSIVDSVNTCFLLSYGMGGLEYSIGNYPGLGGGSIVSNINENGFRLFVLSFTDTCITIYDYENGVYQKGTRTNPKYSFGFIGNRKEQDLYLGKSIIDTFDSETFDNFFTYFKGDIDDLLIYNRILTDDEIKYFFNLIKQ